MFEKAFTNQIERITEVLGWDLEEVSNLESLFGVTEGD
jgi:hypothetical protein